MFKCAETCGKISGTSFYRMSIVVRNANTGLFAFCENEANLDSIVITHVEERGLFVPLESMRDYVGFSIEQLWTTKPRRNNKEAPYGVTYRRQNYNFLNMQHAFEFLPRAAMLLVSNPGDFYQKNSFIWDRVRWAKQVYQSYVSSN